MKPTFHPLGDRALVVEFSEEVDVAANDHVIALGASFQATPVSGVTEVVPTYRSLQILYDPIQLRGAALEAEIRSRLTSIELTERPARRWRVPVAYGGEIGLDLEELAEMKGMTTAELIELHSSAEYRVFMIGFAPGFAYLGGVPKALHTPRLPQPRQAIPAGAIGLGGQQASINSVPGPSGWRFLGWTPWRAFDPNRPRPFLFEAGDRVKFMPVSIEEAREIAKRIAAGEDIARPDDTP
ncbi:5-oxoprolinase subunit PxpB [Tropicimonas sp. IMCC6043]|uniref:5-oxoprolinase subunit PxpB n=1 Tax=Tropicimonas sp. IMCC6043 TaxID=2510645 RepID=UPI00101C0268|nr:5-oxoprolinase subunit PxpB [Tropicimonas sp. IMCC6043]RYH06088.1 5-oxoprolinase subunit PxpB [Tropicimonas sp. IMCC6043]